MFYAPVVRMLPSTWRFASMRMTLSSRGRRWVEASRRRKQKKFQDKKKRKEATKGEEVFRKENLCYLSGFPSTMAMFLSL